MVFASEIAVWRCSGCIAKRTLQSTSLVPLADKRSASLRQVQLLLA